MIALTGIVFSLAFVMMQFSATVYSPRLVLWIARDPGIFSATFPYSFAAIEWIERDGRHGTSFVSRWLVIALLLASVGMFIALIEKISLLRSAPAGLIIRISRSWSRLCWIMSGALEQRRDDVHEQFHDGHGGEGTIASDVGGSLGVLISVA